MRRLIIIFLVLFIFDCKRKVDPTMFKTKYLFKNSLNSDVKIFYFKEGYTHKHFSIVSGEQYFLAEIREEKGGVAGNLELRTSDSVKIEFADGKSKVDYLEDYISSSSKSIFQDEYYTTINNCPNQSKCSQYIYIIDEQDYAEAK